VAVAKETPQTALAALAVAETLGLRAWRAQQILVPVVVAQLSLTLAVMVVRVLLS
jgi:hypothetical protein